MKNETTGAVVVNGASSGSFDTNHRYRVTVDCQLVGEQWFASTEVYDETTQTQVCMQSNHPMCHKPTVVYSSAGDVISLVIQ